jgi:prepilin-type N-terminal cleavage/methylation domain-containing protein
MKTAPSKNKKGMTLLELTVVILVLLSLIGILFVGGRAWKKGSDRAASTLQIRNVQQAVRSYSNFNQKNPGDANAIALTDIFGPGKFIEKTSTEMLKEGNHPAGGKYKFAISEATTIPLIGHLYMKTGGTPDENGEPTTYYDPDSTKIGDW